MHLSPIAIILIVVAIFMFAGGGFYRSGAYAPYGYGIGSVLLLLFILYLVGVL